MTQSLRNLSLLSSVSIAFEKARVNVAKKCRGSSVNFPRGGERSAGIALEQRRTTRAGKRRARQTRVERPFAKLLGRKREIGCNPCAANRKCRTNIFVPSSFSVVRSFRREFPSFSYFLASPVFPLSSFSRVCSSEIIATPPIVSWWYGGLAQAQTPLPLLFETQIVKEPRRTLRNQRFHGVENRSYAGRVARNYSTAFRCC